MDNIAFYWFGWKDYPFEYKPAFQIMKELYDEEKQYQPCATYTTSSVQTYDPDWIDIRITPFVPVSETSNEEDDVESDEDASVTEEEPTEYAFYDQAIYKKFSYS